MVKFILLLLVICIVSSLSLSSTPFKCVPKEACDKLTGALKNPQIKMYLDSLPKVQKDLMQKVYLDHCVQKTCKIAISCQNITTYQEDIKKVPANIKAQYEDVRAIFKKYCSDVDVSKL